MARKRTEEPEVEQGYIDPEFAPKKNARIHKAAKRYYGLMLERKAAGDEEKASHDTLLNIMLEEGVDSYEYQDLKVAVDTSKKCKVKLQGEGSAESNGESEE
jgi:hypothetical protein